MAFAGRVTVNLNYTVSSAALKACCETAGLKHVITSRKFHGESQPRCWRTSDLLGRSQRQNLMDRQSVRGSSRQTPLASRLAAVLELPPKKCR